MRWFVSITLWALPLRRSFFFFSFLVPLRVWAHTTWPYISHKSAINWACSPLPTAKCLVNAISVHSLPVSLLLILTPPFAYCPRWFPFWFSVSECGPSICRHSVTRANCAASSCRVPAAGSCWHVAQHCSCLPLRTPLSLCSITAPSWFPLGLLTVAFIFHLPTWRHFVVCSVFSCLPPGSGCGCAGQPSTHIPPSRLSSFLWWTVGFVVFPITLTAPALYLPPTLLVF